VEATPPAMEEDEACARPENQEDVEAGEVMIAAARLTARSSRVVWRLGLGLDRAGSLARGRRECVKTWWH
jgi:hypothetical protein